MKFLIRTIRACVSDLRKWLGERGWIADRERDGNKLGFTFVLLVQGQTKVVL